MGFEAKAEGRATDGMKVSPSLEENYRRWLRSFRNRINSELAGEERAAEWLKNALPRLEEEGYKYRKGADEDSKLQLLKDFALDSMLREAEVRVREEVEKAEEDEKKRCAARKKRAVVLRSKMYLAITGFMLLLLSVLMFSVFFFIPTDHFDSLDGIMSLSEFRRFMRFEVAVSMVFGVSLLVRACVIRSLIGGTDGNADAAQPSSPPSDAV